MNDEKILNYGVALALEFGTDWLQPIHSRLSQKFSDLDREQLVHYDLICRKAMRFGHEAVHEALTMATRNKTIVSQSSLFDHFSETMKNQFSWMDSENLKRIFNQGFYYAWKDGFDMSTITP